MSYPGREWGGQPDKSMTSRRMQRHEMSYCKHVRYLLASAAHDKIAIVIATNSLNYDGTFITRLEAIHQC